jgi:amidophosphoribosyltransferase
MAGLVGSGASFVARDPAGIRPAYFYADDEVVVIASEKPAIKTAFNIEYSAIQEIKPGHALIINKNGEFGQYEFREPLEKKSCSFERIYFSRGSDPDIYKERKELGRLLIPQILKSINYDLENTVFSYIPNTAESSFLGMIAGLDDYLVDQRKKVIKEGKISGDELDQILAFRPRVEKLVIKDTKIRTFITEDSQRDDLATHVYDTTYEVVRKGLDTLVVIDDSIVRGTTLEKSILKMLDRLNPKKIIIVSSAPQIRFPDCYGIDMSKFGEFIAFRAMLALIKDHGMDGMLEDVYFKCIASKEDKKAPNHVKELFSPFTDEQISAKIAQLVTAADLKAEVDVIYQTVDNLHKACPHHIGDWYFTGNYPTAGGNKVVNKAFVNYMEGKKVRAY